MEVFTELWTGVKYLYYFYFVSIHTVTSLVLPTKYAVFATAFILNYIPIALVSRRAFGMRLIELMRRHYGLWIYTLFIAFFWLAFTDDGAISMANKKEAASLTVGFICTFAGVWGILQLRGEQYTIQRGIERSRGYDELDN